MPDKIIRAAIDQMSEGIQIIDKEWRYLYLNTAAAKQGKAEESQLLGKTMMECYLGIERSPFWRDLEYVMETGNQRRIENEFEFEDGSKGWFELFIESHSHGILIRSLDISERKKLEEQLRHSQRTETINHLAAGIAHDFNNKLGIIMAYTEMARESIN